MPIAINATGVSAIGTATATLNFMVNIDGSAVNNCLFVHVAGRASTIASTTGVVSMTYGSQACSVGIKAMAAGSAGDDCFSEIWKLVNPSGGNNTCTVTVGVGQSKAYGFCLKGVDQVRPFENTATVTGVAVTVTGIITATTENSWILNGLGYIGNYASGAAGVLIDTGTVSGEANWVEEYDTGVNASGGFAFAWNGPVTTPQLQTGTWTGTPGIKNALAIGCVRPAIDPVGGSRWFNTVGDVITANSEDDIMSEDGALTISMLIKPFSNGIGATSRVINRGVLDIRGPALLINSTSTLDFIVNGTTFVQFSSDNSIVFGQWNHVVVTWDGSMTAANCHIYVNAVETTYKTTTNGASPADNSADPIRIGNVNTVNRTFDGMIAHLELFNRVLNISEIRMLYNKPGSVLNGRVRYYPLHGNGSPEPDLAGITGKGKGAVVTGTRKGLAPPIGRSTNFSRNRPVYKHPASGVVQLTIDLALAMALAEANSKDTTKVLVQGIALTESKALDTLKVLLDSLTLSHPIFSPSKDILKAFSETFSMTESQAKDFIKVLSEAFTLTDTPDVAIQGVLRVIDEVLSITLTDTISKDVIKNMVQSLILTESKSLDYLKVLTQSMTLTESIAINFLKVLTQAATLTESQSKDFLKVLSQSITVSESPSKDIIKALSQALTVTESQAKDFLKVISQAMTLTETSNLSLVQIISYLITFLPHGNIETHDKIWMERELNFTGLHKMDTDLAKKELVSTGIAKQDDQDMTVDTDRINWDFHNE